jgi:GT2 family glycosyltransferase
MRINLICIINYKNIADTVQCLESIIQFDPEAGDIIIIDNESDGTLNAAISRLSLQRTCEIIQNPENRGFAAAANQSAKIAEQRGYRYITLVNNDTFINSAALSALVDSAEKNTKRYVLGFIPVILYADHPTKIWNAGGELLGLGFRRCQTADCEVTAVNEAPDLYTYATGCFVMFDVEQFSKIGMYDERFFFGEDDFNLAVRMLKIHKKFQLVKRSRVFHKVSATVEKVVPSSLSRIYLYYLNRFIDIKISYGPFYFLLFSILNLFYINIFIFSWKIGAATRWRFLSTLIKESLRRDSVPRGVFENARNYRW